MLDLQLSDNELQNITLMLIEELLQSNRRSLKDFPSMPYPQGYVTNRLGNKLIYAERDYDTTKLNEEFQNYFKSLTGCAILYHVKLFIFYLSYFRNTYFNLLFIRCR